MSDTKTIVTSVRAEGKATADFDQASFSVSATAHAPTGPKARDLLKPIVKQIAAALKTLVDEGVVIDDSYTRSSNTVTPTYDYAKGKQRFTGYDAHYTMSFVTTTLDNVSKIQDVLTGIDEVSSDPPAFGVKDPEALKLAALQDAFKRIEARFAAECGVFGKDPNKFHVYTWGVDYGDRRGGPVRAFAMAAGAGPSAAPEAPMDINSGKAEIAVNVSVNYAAN